MSKFECSSIGECEVLICACMCAFISLYECVFECTYSAREARSISVSQI